MKTRFAFAAAMLAAGLSGMVAQIVLLRELLVSFLGNELSIGIILGNWLALEAAGSYLGKGIEGRRDRLGLFILVTLLFSACLPASLFLARTLKTVFGIKAGEGLGSLHMLALSVLILLPVALSHGALFTMGAKIYSLLTGRGAPAAGAVYFLEVLGTAGGGVLFSYALLPFLDSFAIAFVIAALNLLVCLMLLRLRLRELRPPTPLPSLAAGLAIACLTGLTIYGLAGGKTAALNRLALRKQWGRLEILYSENSPYGNIAVTRREQQYDFYVDGLPVITLPNPDVAAAEELAHFPLLYHDRPRSVLLISGGAGGVLNEIEKHAVERIDYAELDPLLFAALDRFATPAIQAEWRNPRVFIHSGDGRLFLARTRKSYDVVLIGLSNPSDLQVNRFFTAEFFSLVRSRLSPGGILSLTLPGSLTYLSEELKQLNGCLLATLRQAFPHVFVIPGEANQFFASSSVDFNAVGAGELKTRLGARRIDTRVVTPRYIDYRLRPDRQAWFADSLKLLSMKDNRDFRPREVFHSLGLWNAQFSPYAQKLFRTLGRLTLAPLAAFCGALALLIVALRFLFPHRAFRLTVPFAVASTGFCGMIFDLVIVFSFQVLLGYVYQRIGLIIAFFMAGTGLGGMAATVRLARIRNPLRALIGLDLLLLLFSAFLAFLPQILLPPILAGGGAPAGEAAFLAAAAAAGALIGAQFPLAVAVHQKAALSFSRTVGLLNAADLLGGWFAGVLGGVVLLPLLGLAQTCLLLIMLKLCSLLLLFLTYCSSVGSVE